MRPTRVLLCGLLVGAAGCTEGTLTSAPEVRTPIAPFANEGGECDPTTAIIPCDGGNTGGESGGSGPWRFFGPYGDGLYQAANDPNPSADGIWLGSNVTPDACFRDRAPGVADSDDDWLADHCELELARGFAPSWGMHPEDGCPGGEPAWGAKYFPSAGVVRVAFLPSYYDDCSGGSYYDHRGDSEYTMIEIVFNAETQHWEFHTMFTAAHYGTSNDRSRVVYATGAVFRYRYKAHPWVMIADRKHAAYPSFGACEAPMFQTDRCHGVATAIVMRFPIDPARNIGSRHVKLLDCVPSNGVFAGNGRQECYWRHDVFPNVAFCGWHQTETPCAGHYRTFLMSYLFELRQTSYDDWGP